MSENNFEESPIADERKLVINGKRYHSPTYNVCRHCAVRQDPQYLFVKQRLASTDVVLECPVCDGYETVGQHMVKLRP
jgi:hypothetical protein